MRAFAVIRRYWNEALVVSFILALSAWAFASSTDPLITGNPADRTRVGFIARPSLTIIGTADTSQPLEAGNNTGRALIGWESTIAVTASALGACCFSMDPDLTLGTQGAETATNLGGAPCPSGVLFEAGQTHHLSPHVSLLYAAGTAGSNGYTGTYCAATVLGQHNAPVYPACLDGADCTAVGAGSSCTRTIPNDAAVYLICASAAADSRWSITATR